MSDISSIGPVSSARHEATARAYDRDFHASATSGVSRSDDRVDLSADAARYLERLRQVPPIREELVDEVRAEIKAGAYDTPERFDAALDALLRDLADVPDFGA